jgi:hypothetical protein
MSGSGLDFSRHEKSSYGPDRSFFHFFLRMGLMEDRFGAIDRLRDQSHFQHDLDRLDVVVTVAAELAEVHLPQMALFVNQSRKYLDRGPVLKRRRVQGDFVGRLLSVLQGEALPAEVTVRPLCGAAA